MSQKEDSFHLGVKTLIRSGEGKFLLLQRRKGGYWDIPGGRVNRGESVAKALKRELEEETGLSEINDVSFLTMFKTDIRIPSGDSDVGLILSIYACEVVAAFIPALSEEHMNFGWFVGAEVARLLKDRYPTDLFNRL